jgi:hypothetical protein
MMRKIVFTSNDERCMGTRRKPVLFIYPLLMPKESLGCQNDATVMYKPVNSSPKMSANVACAYFKMMVTGVAN